MAAPLHASELEQQKVHSRVKQLCIVLHPNDKIKLEFNLFLKTAFAYYFL